MRTTSVSKCLDKRLLLFGFEVFDLLAVFLVLSVLNFIFGSSSMKLLFVWLPTVSLAALLRFGKKGKPDKFLIHWVRFQIKPGYYSAFKEPSTIELSPSLGRSKK